MPKSTEQFKSLQVISGELSSTLIQEIEDLEAEYSSNKISYSRKKYLESQLSILYSILEDLQETNQQDAK